MRCNEGNYIKRLKNRKEDALEFIVDKYVPLVKYVVYKVISPLRKDGIIDECINDVFLSVWDNANKFNGQDEDFKKWIYKIAKFKAIDYYRKEVKNNKVILESIETSNNKSSEDEFIISEDRRELINLINTLESIDRDIFIMKFFLGIKSDDIAIKFGMTRSAVDNRIYRAKKKLIKKKDIFNVEAI